MAFGQPITNHASPAPKSSDITQFESMFWQTILILALALLCTSWAATAKQQNLNDFPAMDANEVKDGTLAFKGKNGDLLIAPKLATNVLIEISGQVSHVKVSQTFHNTSDEWVEGVYLFPLPVNAAVNQLEMLVGDRIIVGEIHEKKKAKAIYKKAKASGKKASLVSQQRPNLFTNNVANIPPGGKIRIDISYIDTIPYKDHQYALRFPMTLTPRFHPNTDGISSSSVRGMVLRDQEEVSPPFKVFHEESTQAQSSPNKIELNILLNASIPVGKLASSYHPVNIKRSGKTYQITLDNSEPENMIANRDFELTWQSQTQDQPMAHSYYEQFEQEHFYSVHIEPPNIETASTLSQRLIFIIDTSGSMSGVSMNQAKEALDHALSLLKPDDQFNIIEFNSYASALFNKPMPVTGKNLRKAESFIGGLSANGGTNMHSALNLAFNQMNTTERNIPDISSEEANSEGSESKGANITVNQIIFITDGSVSNETGLFSLIQNKLGNTRLFTVGIGSAPNSYFMEKAASFGKGTFTYIGKAQEASNKIKTLLAKIAKPVLTNIKFTSEGSSDIQLYPQHIPDLFNNEPLTLAIKSKETLSNLKITGSLSGKEWQQDIPITTEKSHFKKSKGWPKHSTNIPLKLNKSSDIQHKGIATLWGRRKINQLMADMIIATDITSIRQEITATALKHHLISKYTSLVAVDKTPVRDTNMPLHTQKVANQLPHGNTMAPYFKNQTGTPQTATDAELKMLTGFILLLIALALHLCQRFLFSSRMEANFS